MKQEEMKQEKINNMLILDESVTFDNSITSYQYNEFMPVTKSNYNQQGQTIEIDIQATDTYYRPSHSYILIKGKLIRSDNDMEQMIKFHS